MESLFNTREKRDKISRRVIAALQNHTKRIWANLDAQEETARQAEDVYEELGVLLRRQRNEIGVLREIVYMLVDDATKSTMLATLERLERNGDPEA